MKINIYKWEKNRYFVFNLHAPFHKGIISLKMKYSRVDFVD